jgi:hypothetical protein
MVTEMYFGSSDVQWVALALGLLIQYILCSPNGGWLSMVKGFFFKSKDECIDSYRVTLCFGAPFIAFYLIGLLIIHSQTPE